MRRQERQRRTRGRCSKMDLDFLHALERERVLDVLRRDKQLRIIEEDRIR